MDEAQQALGADRASSADQSRSAGARHPLVPILARVAAVAAPVLAAAVLAVGLVSAWQGWRLTHPPAAKVVGDPTIVHLVWRCLPLTAPPILAFPCPAGERLYTKGQHIPIASMILPSYVAPYPGTSGDWSTSTVILVPDHGQSRTPQDFPVWTVARTLVDQGYNVVLYDPRGMGESGGAAIGFGTVEVGDLVAVIDYLETEGPVQRHIAVWGLGTGADTAILAAARSPYVGAVIADSPYTSATAYLRRAIPSWTGLPGVPFGLTVPWAMQRETGVNYAAYNPVRAIRSLRVPAAHPRPALIIGGTADQLTPLAGDKRLYQAAGSGADLLQVSQAGHLQAFAKSPPDRQVPSMSEYMCDVLDTLAVMRTGSGTIGQGTCGGLAKAKAPAVG